MYFRISIKNQRNAICIKTDFQYDYEEVFENPELLKNKVFKVYKGAKNMDLVSFWGEPINIAISERLKNILEHHNIKGWSYYPIIIENIEDNYFIFHLTGTGGEVTNREKDGCVPMFKPVKWNEAKWDGSDIFNIEGTAMKICTSKVKEIIERAKLTNIEFEPL